MRKLVVVLLASLVFGCGMFGSLEESESTKNTINPARDTQTQNSLEIISKHPLRVFVNQNIEHPIELRVINAKGEAWKNAELLVDVLNDEHDWVVPEKIMTNEKGIAELNVQSGGIAGELYFRIHSKEHKDLITEFPIRAVKPVIEFHAEKEDECFGIHQSMGNVTVHVRDELSNKPIENVQVALEFSNGFINGLAEGSTVNSLTDADGNVTLSLLSGNVLDNEYDNSMELKASIPAAGTDVQQSKSYEVTREFNFKLKNWEEVPLSPVEVLVLKRIDLTVKISGRCNRPLKDKEVVFKTETFHIKDDICEIYWDSPFNKKKTLTKKTNSDGEISTRIEFAYLPLATHSALISASIPFTEHNYELLRYKTKLCD